MKKKWIILIIIVLVLAVACFYIFSKKNVSVNDNAAIANPASSYCINNGGELEIRTDIDGGQYGVCKRNGLECEEWKFFRGECVLNNISNSCSADLDCVRASCCHAKTCVTKDNVPNCVGASCTMDCQPGTLDCGQGSCKCSNGKCEAVFA